MIFSRLAEEEYIKESIHPISKNRWFLHVNKIENMSPEQLFKKNIAFNQLEKDCKVKLYDGWDVEQLD